MASQMRDARARGEVRGVTSNTGFPGPAGCRTLLIAATLIAALAPVLRSPVAPGGAGLLGGEPGLPSPAPFLIAQGPNDGEPLSRDVPIEILTNVQDPGHLLIYHESRLLGSADILPLHDPRSLLGLPRVLAPLSVRRFTYPLDTTLLPNGHARLSLLLLDWRYSAVLAAVTWEAHVENPVIRVADRPGGPMATLEIQGRRGDTWFALLAGTDRPVLDRPPEPGSAAEARWAIARGALESNPGAALLAGEAAPRREIVLNVDNLFRIHSLNVELVLWTLHPERGWARSRFTALHRPPADGEDPEDAGPGTPRKSRDFNTFLDR